MLQIQQIKISLVEYISLKAIISASPNRAFKDNLLIQGSSFNFTNLAPSTEDEAAYISNEGK